MTRTLSLLGAALPRKLLPPHPTNPVGFWEAASVADFNDEILQALDSEWDDIFSFRSRAYLSNFDRFYTSRAIDLLDQEFGAAEVIALKDPRISILTAFWDRTLREAGYQPHYVVMVRNPLEVAESLRSRNGFPREKSLLLWSSYMIAVNRDTRGAGRTFVSYDQLMSDWRTVRTRIQAASGVPFPRDTAAAAVDIDRHLDVNLHHHHVSTDELSERSEIPAQVQKIYRIFRAACDDAMIDDALVDAIEAELSQVDRLVGPLVADLKSAIRNLSRELTGQSEARASAEASAAEAIQGLQGERDVQTERLSEFEARLEGLVAERDQVSHHLAEEKQRVEQLIRHSTAFEDKVIRLEDQISAERERRLVFENRVRQLTDSLHIAEATKGDLEERFNSETSALSKQVMISEQSAELERDKKSRIISILGAISSEPRWWSILPGRRRSKLRHARLRRLGLFDAQSYLDANADVAAADEDPLHHFVHHGIEEDRPLGGSTGV